MTTLTQRVAEHFNESIQTKQQAAQVLAQPTAQAAELLFNTLSQISDGLPVQTIIL